MTINTNNLQFAALVVGGELYSNGKGQVRLMRNEITFENAVQEAIRQGFGAIVECERKYPNKTGDTGSYYLKGKGMNPCEINAALYYPDVGIGGKGAHHQRRVWILKVSRKRARSE